VVGLAKITSVEPVFELDGRNVELTPAGSPVSENVTVPVKPEPAVTVMGTVVPVPACRVKDSVGAVTVKSGPLISSVKSATSVAPPEVAATATE
jgi:hypothetical protein